MPEELNKSQNSDDSDKGTDDVISPRRAKFREVVMLHGFSNFIQILLGLGFIILGLIFLFVSFCDLPWIQSFACYLPGKCDGLSLGYLGAGFVLVGFTAYMIGRHRRRENLKRAEFQEDVESLIADVEMDIQRNQSHENEKNRIPIAGINEIEKVIVRLKIKNKDKAREVLFLETIPLRKMQIDLYDDEKLQLKAELELQDFKDILLEAEELDEKSREYYRLYENKIKDNADKPIKLREVLKNLRDLHQNEMNLQGTGEAIIESVSRWAPPAIPLSLLIGILPLLSKPYFYGPLTLINWIFLGATGSILYIVFQIKGKDTTLVGGDEGIRVLRMLVLGTTIGMMSAVLLYSLLLGEALGGGFFPDLQESASSKQVSKNGLSIFWGVFSGFSVKFFGKLMGTAEREVV